MHYVFSYSHAMMHCLFPLESDGSVISQQHYCRELTCHWYLCFTVSTLMQMYLCALIMNK